MHWNEKIALIKQKYSDQDFSVPHVDRKEILRKIETKFIRRVKEYYDLNNFNERFSNWWADSKDPIEVTAASDIRTQLSSVLDQDERFWIACEFPGKILLYKSTLAPALNLISIGQTWTQTFHVIQIKYDFMLSFRLVDGEIRMKSSGSDEFKEIRNH